MFEQVDNAITSAESVAEHTANRSVGGFFLHSLNSRSYEFVVIVDRHSRRSIGTASHSLQDAFLRLADNLAGRTKPSKDVEIVVCFGVGNNTSVCHISNRFGRINHIAKSWNDLSELRIGIGGIFPDLERLWRKVNIAVFLLVENTAFLVEHIFEVLFITLEEHFIRTDDISVCVDTVVKTFAERNNLFHALSREERIASDFICFLPNTIHTTCTLNKSDNSPRQIEVHDKVAVLEVLTFRKHIGSNDYAILIFGSHIRLVVAYWRKFLDNSGWIFRATCHDCDLFNATFYELAINVVGSIGILRKHNDLFAFVSFTKEFLQLIELLVGLRNPISAKVNHLQNSFAVLFEFLFECPFEEFTVNHRKVVLRWNDIVVFFSLTHIDIEVSRNDYLAINLRNGRCFIRWQQWSWVVIVKELIR